MKQLPNKIVFDDNETYTITEKNMDEHLSYVDVKTKEIIFKKGLLEVEKWFLLLYQLINLCVHKLKKLKVIRKAPPNIFTVCLTHLLFKTMVKNNFWNGLNEKDLDNLYLENGKSLKH